MITCSKCGTSYSGAEVFCPKDGTRLIAGTARHQLKSVPPQGDPLIGKTIQGRYRVLKHLGSGGMGVVYIAEHVEIEKKVAEATGRPFALGGDLDLSVFPWIGISLSDLHLGNPSGFKEQDFVSIESFEVRVKLLPLLSRKVEVKRFVMKKPQIALIKRKDGVGNWEGIGKTSKAKEVPETGKERMMAVDSHHKIRNTSLIVVLLLILGIFGPLLMQGGITGLTGFGIETGEEIFYEGKFFGMKTADAPEFETQFESFVLEDGRLAVRFSHDAAENKTLKVEPLPQIFSKPFQEADLRFQVPELSVQAVLKILQMFSLAFVAFLSTRQIKEPLATITSRACPTDTVSGSLIMLAPGMVLVML